MFYLYYALAEWFSKGHEIWIDLGRVKNLGKVFVNGKSMGVVWKIPFRADRTCEYLSNWR